ncbi:MAG: hypothetical protein R3F53_04220 [Gammaproteobacteria bacterium]
MDFTIHPRFIPAIFILKTSKFVILWWSPCLNPVREYPTGRGTCNILHTWLEGTFNDYTSVDRQTVLNDDDGSLTGLVNTLSVNEDPFFNAPVEVVECLSDGTAKTSPYHYLTTAIYPDCAVKGRENCGVNEKVHHLWTGGDPALIPIAMAYLYTGNI